MAKKDGRVIIQIEGCEESAFRLLARAKKALYQNGWKNAEVEAFAVEAGCENVVKYATGAAPAGVYGRVLATVKKHCLIR